VTGPIDESRHTMIRVSEDGTHIYTPKPERELTDEDRKRIAELQAIERLQDHLYAKRARRRKPKESTE
jgi:hypothetical protein